MIYEVAIGWSAINAGVFTWGVSRWGGTDVWASAFGHNVFENIDMNGGDITIRRGRTEDLGGMEAGSCTLTVLDRNQTYNPENTSSPLYGVNRLMRPVRVRAVEGNTIYPLFYGFTERITSEADWGRQRATIECTDLFAWLAADANDGGGARPVIPSTGPTTTGAAIGKVLDAVEWTQPSMRRLAVGDPIPNFSADGSKTALTLIAELLTAERGVFFINGAGVAVYEDRAARNKAPRTSAQSTITGQSVRHMPTEEDVRRVKNRARVLRTGGTLQTAWDEPSHRAYGWRVMQTLETPYLTTDTQAQSLAELLVLQRKSPLAKLLPLELSSIDPTYYTAILSRDLNDRVMVDGRDYHIEQLEHRISSGQPHTAAWLLSKRAPGQPFIWGVSTWGGSDVYLY